MIEKVPTRYGPMFIPDTDSGQYWWLKQIGASPEDEFIDAVCELLKERPGTALDIGANFGCWTLRLAQCCKRVVAYEPQTCVVELLRRTVRENRLGNVSVVHAAVGAALGLAKIPDTDLARTSNFGGISINQPHPEHPGAAMLDVPMIAIDHVATPDRQINFMKIDVEGYETEVIKGARATIARCRPILFVESDHPLTDTAELAWMIEELGYSIEQRGNNFMAMPL